MTNEAEPNKIENQMAPVLNSEAKGKFDTLRKFFTGVSITLLAVGGLLGSGTMVGASTIDLGIFDNVIKEFSDYYKKTKTSIRNVLSGTGTETNYQNKTSSQNLQSVAT